jgi:hypothetical protein
MEEKKEEGASVYGASAKQSIEQNECPPYVVCPCDVKSIPCAHCGCAPRSCACRVEAVQASITEEHNPIMLAILRTLEEGKTINDLLADIHKMASDLAIHANSETQS